MSIAPSFTPCFRALPVKFLSVGSYQSYSCLLGLTSACLLGLTSAIPVCWASPVQLQSIGPYHCSSCLLGLTKAIFVCWALPVQFLSVGPYPSNSCLLGLASTIPACWALPEQFLSVTQILALTHPWTKADKDDFNFDYYISYWRFPDEQSAPARDVSTTTFFKVYRQELLGTDNCQHLLSVKLRWLVSSEKYKYTC